MRYVGKNLPAWVRLQRRPTPMPVYTVPTRSQWRIQQMVETTLRAMAPRMADSVTRNNALLERLQARRPNQ
jgi:predicted GTPase